MPRLLISDQLWLQLEVLLILAKVRSGRKSQKGDRLFLEAVLYMARTGNPWRDLPEYFGKWLTIYQRFRRWDLNGTWERFFQGLERMGLTPQFEALYLDSTTVRAHRHAAGAPKKGALTRLRDLVAHEAA